jgi:serine/threonine-protein kinase
VALTRGGRLGFYELVAPLGAGGMGEVYRARDTRLKRDVAIKILPDAFASDPERLARFDREAETLASLNHPNIAQVYGLETAVADDGRETHAIVMELVEGEDLSQRLERGAVPLEEALPIARQIADALEAAHDGGVVHRDLKPANVKVRSDGTVKVLDFGLAKLMDAGAGVRPDGSANKALDSSPTISSPAMTGRGTILGTAAYMSPEQARGGAMDRRADIWAFGCVLFELLTGHRAFAGGTMADVLADVLRKEIEWARLPAHTPPVIRDLLRRCLTRDPRARLRDIGDARVVIEEVIASPARQDKAAGHRPSTLLGTWLVAACGVAAAAAALAVWSMTRPDESRAADVHASIELSDGVNALSDSVLAVSTDGRTLAFAGRRKADEPWQLYLRRLDEPGATPIPGTDDAFDPFFSPDGRSVGFFARQKLWIAPVSGGVVTELADAPDSRGGWWGPDGSIAYAPVGQRGGVVMSVPSSGGVARPLTTLHDREVTNRWPQVLPGGKGVLYTAHSQTGTYDNANLVVSSLSGDRRQVVVERGYFGRYFASGHLAYVHKGTLFVAPFDLERLVVTGPAAPFIEGVTGDPTSGAALFGFSDTGALVYSRGPGRVPDMTIWWIDETGAERPMRTVPGDYASLRFSPDGRHLAMDVGASWGEAAISTYDWARDIMTRVSIGAGEDIAPVWSPDGRRIAFAGQRDGAVVDNIYWQKADGSGTAERIAPSDATQIPFSWHPSGRFLAFHTGPGPTRSDIGILPLEGDESSGWKVGQPSIVLSEPYVEGLPAFSPDGRWLAYTSFESGQPEVYVRPFPALDSKVKVSADTGAFPMWSPARSELFYTSPEGIWVAAHRTTGGEFVVDKPRLWAAVNTWYPRGGAATMALHPDGRRFAMLKGAPIPELTHVSLMLDAFGRVRRALQATNR